MSVYTEALDQVIANGKLVLISCTDKKNQESIRTILYHLKSKVIPPNMQEEIGITRVELNGQLFVKVYQRPAVELYTLDEEGKLVPLIRPGK